MSLYPTIFFVALGLLTTLYTLYDLLIGNATQFGDASKKCPYVWHGGSPTHKGSCWCGEKDKYCLCTPSLAIDAIIEFKNHKDDISIEKVVDDDVFILLVQRRDPPKNIFAIPGGFVNIGESAETAVLREVKEETNLTLSLSDLEQFHLYSNPNRDARRHTVSIVFRCLYHPPPSVNHQQFGNMLTNLHTGDDAKEIKVLRLKEVLSLPLAFDHKDVITDYIHRFHPSLLQSS